MRAEIKERIEQVKQGTVPKGYIFNRAILSPTQWPLVSLNSVLYENKDRNDKGLFDRNDVLSVSGESGIVNQIDFMGRSYAGESVLNYHVVYPGNIVYTKSPLKENPYGIIKLNKGDSGIVSTLYAVYHCKSTITGFYLDYYFSVNQYLNNYLKPLVKRGAKNDMKVNNEDAIRGLISLPPVAEQEKIVEILTQFDKVIKLKNQLIEEKKQRKKWLMQNLLNPKSGIRLQGFKEKWIKRSFASLGSFSKGTGISNDDCVKGDLPCIKYGDIYMSYNTWFEKSVSYTDILAAKLSPKVSFGTLLFTGSGEDRMEIGKCTAYLGTVPLAVGGDIIIMDPDSQKVDPLFLAYQQSTELLIRQKARIAQGYSIVHLYGKHIKGLQIWIPPTTEEQTAIANVLSVADHEIDLLEQELSQWQTKKKSLMKLLLTGLVRINI